MRSIPAKYQPTIRTTVEALDQGQAETLRPGQWVEIVTPGGWPFGPRGQYLGKTRQGVFVIRWQRAAKWTGKPEENTATRELRDYARRFGSL